MNYDLKETASTVLRWLLIKKRCHSHTTEPNPTQSNPIHIQLRIFRRHEVSRQRWRADVRKPMSCGSWLAGLRGTPRPLSVRLGIERTLHPQYTDARLRRRFIDR